MCGTYSQIGLKVVGLSSHRKR